MSRLPIKPLLSITGITLFVLLTSLYLGNFHLQQKNTLKNHDGTSQSSMMARCEWSILGNNQTEIIDHRPLASLAMASLKKRTARQQKLENQALQSVKKEWHQRFQAIFRERCTVCHGPGGLREDKPFLKFEHLMDNPGLIAHTVRGEHGQYAQSDKKVLLRWLENSFIPAMEKTSLTQLPPSSLARDYEKAEMYDGWQEKKPKAYPHPQNWEKTHRFRARVDRRACFLCHQSQSFCLDCHSKKKPHDHRTRQWIARVHQIKGRVQPQRCSACHRANYCSNCHRLGFH